ncbi:hypothetical protein [Protaetiibacter intestinalis]|uniref:Uncharacterized protein n=1 Tax=Protaetiibacter intestinalis TaxID=2419774 RepID=A0A387B5P1_9MICO|nr:hypothetical protein [Protaetiibacter intestinalis]AYF97723.1 hypothetical protein D7I47_05290 [Protaetiibacter intestinalis]
MSEPVNGAVPAASAPTRAGLYWRRGASVTAGIMTLDAGVLSFRTERETVFSAPVDRVSAEFTRFSTLVVTSDGHRHVFVTGAYAGNFAREFSTAQLAELAGAPHASEAAQAFREGAAIVVSSGVMRSAAVIAGSAAGAAFALVGDAVGVASLFGSQSRSFALARAWAEHLAANGVAVRMRGTTFARSQAFIAAIVLPSVAVFGVGVWLLLSALAS